MNIQPFSYYHPIEFHFGAGKFIDVPMMALRFGIHGLLCVDGFIQSSNHYETSYRQLKKVGCSITNEIVISGEPESAMIDVEIARNREQQCDFILAIGGGSTIDFAKAMSIGLINEGSVWEYTNAARPGPKVAVNPTVPVIAVPTTSGSGSEMSALAVLTNKKSGLKSAIVSPVLYPKIAIVDPELTTTAPRQLRMMVAIDALAHGFENFLNVRTVSEIHRFIGLEATKRIAPFIDDLCKETVNENILAQVALGSSLAGWSNAFGTTGAAHAIAQSLGAKFNLPHAVAVALVLPEVLDRTWPAIPNIFASAAIAFGIEPIGSHQQICRNIIEWWRSRYCVAVAQHKLARVSWNDQDVDYLARQIIETMERPLKRHPIIFTLADIKNIINSVLIKKAVPL